MAAVAAPVGVTVTAAVAAGALVAYTGGVGNAVSAVRRVFSSSASLVPSSMPNIRRASMPHAGTHHASTPHAATHPAHVRRGVAAALFDGISLLRRMPGRVVASEGTAAAVSV